MESEEKKIAKVLKDIGFSHLLQYFIDEEFTLESFRLLTLDIVKEFLPKAGPRILFWSRYTRYFQNEQRKTKGIPPVPPAATAFESDSDKDSDDPLSDPLSDANIEFTFELPTSTQIVKEEPRVLDEELFENLLESATLIPTPQTTPSTSLNLRKTTPSTSTKNSSTVCTVAQYTGSKSVKEHLNTAQGALLRNKYKKHQTFDDRDRGLLARMIVYKEYESLGITPAQKFKLTNERLKYLAEEIAQVFPNENPDTYYFPYNSATRAKCTGKLWHCYNAFKRQLRMSRVDTVIPEESNDDESPAAHSILANSSNSEDILEAWKQTLNYRRQFLNNPDKTVEDYFKKYPILESPESYQLLLEDFNTLHPRAGNKFLEKWPEVNRKLVNIARFKLNKTEVAKIEKGTPEELQGFLFLPYLLPNSYLPRNNEGKRVRLCRSEIEQFLILFIQDGYDVPSVLRRENDKYKKQCIPIRPRLVFVGKSYLKITRAFVEVNLTLYKMEDPLTAIDAYVKIALALNEQYACGANPIWTFIQQYIYEIKSERDSVYTSVNVLLSEIILPKFD